MAYLDDHVLVKIAEALGNEEAVKIIDILKHSGEVTDDEIANKTGIRLNSVRKILYKLYDHSLVAMRQTRDQETGWFIFYWRLQPDQLEGFIINQKRRVLEKLRARLEYEKTHDFYYCFTPGCQKIPFEEAMELVFRCPKCGKQLMHYDNSKIIDALEKKIEQLRKELGD